MNKLLAKHVFFPVWETAAGRKTMQFLSEFEKSQYYPLEMLQDLQNDKLRKLIEHAYINVPYYRKIFDDRSLEPKDIQTTEDLHKLPMLTKEIVADNFESLKAKNMNRFKPKYYTTGGTSGRHLHFYNAQDVFDAHMAAAYRAWRWSGWDFGVRYAYIWGASMDLKNETTLKKKIRTLLTENRLLIQALMFTEESLKRDCQKLIEFKPDYVISYPSSLVIISKYMQGKGFKLSLKGIITSSEKLFPWQRDVIEGNFNCRIYDDYGNRESSIRATQCEQCKGYHIASENGIIETVRNGKNVIGESGRVLLTEFNNYAMPLIRYENTDIATLSKENCTCGRTLPLLEKIDGRISDIFVTSDGRYLPSEYFMVAFLNFTGEFYQVIQDRKEEILIRIVKGRHFRESDLDTIKKTMKQWLGEKTKVTYEFTDEIPLTAQGKRRYFISKVPLEF